MTLIIQLTEIFTKPTGLMMLKGVLSLFTLKIKSSIWLFRISVGPSTFRFSKMKGKSILSKVALPCFQ